MKIIYLILLTNIVTIFSYIENSYFVLYLAAYFFNFLLLFSMFFTYLNVLKFDKNELFNLIELTIDKNSYLQKIYKYSFLSISFFSFSISITFSFYFKEYLLSIFSLISVLLFILNIKFLKQIKKEYFKIKEEKEEQQNKEI